MNQVSNSVSAEPFFPKDFLWGAATASHQVEGNTVNDWSEWEKEHALRLAKEAESHFGHLPCWERVKKEALDPSNYLSGSSTDHYHRFEEDFDILRSLNGNVYRFSLEWSRIEPKEGIFDEQEIEHYRKVIQALRVRDIEPFVTLWHWTLPLWLRDEDGLLSPKFPEYFSRYAEKVLEALGSDIRFVVTLNEPDVVTSHSYLKGAWPPQHKNFFKFFRATFNLINAHKKAYVVIKKMYPDIQIGIAKHNVYFETAKNNVWNTLLKNIAHYIWNKWWLNRIKDFQDFIGLNHYHRNVVDGWYGKNPNEIVTDFGWEFVPESLTGALTDLISYGKPIYVTENGLADATDELRQQFIPRALAAIEKALQQGADVRGYMYWSLLDNFEWDKGYWLKFGLIAVDRSTFERTVRPSAQMYANLIKKNRGL